VVAGRRVSGDLAILKRLARALKAEIGGTRVAATPAGSATSGW